jgi:hypothetical protein
MSQFIPKKNERGSSKDNIWVRERFKELDDVFEERIQASRKSSSGEKPNRRMKRPEFLNLQETSI